MNADFSVKIYETTECQPEGADKPVYIGPPAIVNSASRFFSTILFNKVCRQIYKFIFIGLLLYLLLAHWMNYDNVISMKRLDRITLPFLTVNHNRKTPTLAIVMSISPDLINGSIARISVANKRNYVKKHDYEFILGTVIDQTRSAVWSKIVTIHSAMHMRPDIEWFWCLDMDAFILEQQIDIYDQVTKKYQWGLEKDHNVTKDILISNDCTSSDSFNDGSFLIRNSQWSKNAMRIVYEKQYWDRHFKYEEQDTLFWLYKNHQDWGRQVQIFPMRLANSFPKPLCGEQERSVYQQGDMVVHYAGYRKRLPHIWPHELEKWRNKGKLVNDIEVDVFVK